MDFRHLIVTCLFSKLRLPFDNQKVKENYAIFFKKHPYLFCIGTCVFVHEQKIDDSHIYMCNLTRTYI